MSEATKQIEFEIKAPVNDFNDIKQLLQGVQDAGEDVNTDTYYDVESYALFKLGIFVRLRNNHTLDIKFNPDLNDKEHNICNEYSFRWPLNKADRASAENFLKSYLPRQNAAGGSLIAKFNLKEFLTITKKRKTFRGEGVLICFDEVEGLGNFVEIEATTPHKISFVMDYCRKLGLENMPLGYVELLLRATNYPIYRQGRYLLKKDV